MNICVYIYIYLSFYQSIYLSISFDVGTTILFPRNSFCSAWHSPGVFVKTKKGFNFVALCFCSHSYCYWHVLVTGSVHVNCFLASHADRSSGHHVYPYWCLSYNKFVSWTFEIFLYCPGNCLSGIWISFKKFAVNQF